MKKRDIYEILCWGVILVTAMAMAVLGSTENLWYDEAYTVAMIQHPVREIVEGILFAMRPAYTGSQNVFSAFSCAF